jgi:hypothetical protein
MADHNDIQQVINVLLAAFPNFKPSEQTTEIYWQTLHDIPTEELRAGVLHCLTESGRAFAPSVGEIRGAVAELRGMLANVPSSYQAWQEVQTQILENGGEFGNPAWSNPLVEKAVKRIGWRNLRMSDFPESERARFIACYEQLVSRAEREEMLIPEVRGYIEANGGKLLSPASQIGLLADKLTVKR